MKGRYNCQNQKFYFQAGGNIEINSSLPFKDTPAKPDTQLYHASLVSPRFREEEISDIERLIEMGMVYTSIGSCMV